MAALSARLVLGLVYLSMGAVQFGTGSLWGLVWLGLALAWVVVAVLSYRRATRA